MTVATVLLCLLASCSLVFSARHELTDATLVEVADGLTWAENIEIGADSIFVSDLFGGLLYRSYKTTPESNYTTVVHISHLSGLGRFLGLVIIPSQPETLYACAAWTNKTFIIIAASTTVADTWKPVATLGTENGCNGLRANDKTGLLYTSSEGNFLPKDGWVWEINPATGSVTVLINSLWAADGLWIQPDGVMYVGELFSRKIWTYDTATHTAGKLSPGPPTGLLDDFTVASIDGIDTFFGANWLENRLDMWTVSNSTFIGSLLKGEIKNPTSCRFGIEGSLLYPASSLFITEGRGLKPSERNSRVWELRNARTV